MDSAESSAERLPSERGNEFAPLEEQLVNLPGAPRLNFTSAGEHENSSKKSQVYQGKSQMCSALPSFLNNSFENYSSYGF